MLFLCSVLWQFHLLMLWTLPLHYIRYWKNMFFFILTASTTFLNPCFQNSSDLDSAGGVTKALSLNENFLMVWALIGGDGVDNGGVASGGGEGQLIWGLVGLLALWGSNAQLCCSGNPTWPCKQDYLPKCIQLINHRIPLTDKYLTYSWQIFKSLMRYLLLRRWLQCLLRSRIQSCFSPLCSWLSRHPAEDGCCNHLRSHCCSSTHQGLWNGSQKTLKEVGRTQKNKECFKMVECRVILQDTHKLEIFILKAQRIFGFFATFK